ncbi:MAG: hypothetical protein C0410_12580 [Anaerolinea sp.]|nr:hypothetical protein [Anaerolinea sp.]
MGNRKPFQKKYVFYCIATLILVFAFINILRFVNTQNINFQGRQATERAEKTLTSNYKDIAIATVENFEESWLSPEMQKNPGTFLQDLLYGPQLEYWLNFIGNNSEISNGRWSTPRQFLITNLRIVEYSEQRMGIIACVEWVTNETNQPESSLTIIPTIKSENYYLFINDKGTWKLANVIDITDPKQALQDWDYMNQKLKDITGDFPSVVYKNCEIGVFEN